MFWQSRARVPCLSAGCRVQNRLWLVKQGQDYLLVGADVVVAVFVVGSGSSSSSTSSSTSSSR